MIPYDIAWARVRELLTLSAELHQQSRQIHAEAEQIHSHIEVLYRASQRLYHKADGAARVRTARFCDAPSWYPAPITTWVSQPAHRRLI